MTEDSRQGRNEANPCAEWLKLRPDAWQENGQGLGHKGDKFITNFLLYYPFKDEA
jgi:hypothetical protein